MLMYLADTLWSRLLSTLCLKKNDTDVAYYNFDANQSVLISFGR